MWRLCEYHQQKARVSRWNYRNNDRTLKILLIHQYFLEQNDPGGSRFNEMTKVWVREGHEVTVLCGMLNYVTGRIPEKYNGKFIDESEYEPRLM